MNGKRLATPGPRGLAKAAKRRISKRIDQLISAEKWVELEGVISKALVAAPDDHWLHVRRADAWYEQRRYRKAATLYRKVLELMPGCPLGRWGLASAELALGAHPEARKLFQSLAREKPEVMGTRVCGEGVRWARGVVADANFRLGQLAEREGSKVVARRRYRTYLRTMERPALSIESRKGAQERLSALGVRGQDR
ncbi:tetratricopeptide repeat protein [Myxococcus llanfairpwllgwyngyllgogerychwyrndrobwllllantysiliogogogochensis]|uniref:Tetratricopeptide repeat protein n=1 Tax=Myxococcus llanfairpwllgwyngyllgogerychwyrndrobwllllantysiliogogogochensis TaxID=2590453 RepID=A0A540WJ52_9BACT|nr:tetratricopeptide repeat protein [Myxococcus llanfairpwllgwyngyllgogerychwyrndrobwllllantysiliogogogochensis]TQF09021.1 tetratricopeptide repeat protein [Myxococcus llanfairpwllgwyngyllgogerychwyrndrobwllllantysiliogogogochensis]